MTQNSVLLIGRLGSEPKIGRFNDSEVANFSIATDRSWKDKNDQWQTKTTWHNVVKWRPGDLVKNAKPGYLVSVQGSYEDDSYQDESGNTIRRMTVQAEKVYVFKVEKAG
jgi:single-strand DNA-binding protein